MPGRIPGPFRSGNLAENLGVFLLRGIAAVAEVPRPEDIGIDAFSTLLRLDEEDSHYYAEDGFVVQIKSMSVPSIKYGGHALPWLVGQSQPMFIGRVSLRESRMALYPTWSVNQAVFALHAASATIHFTPTDLPNFFRDVPTRWVGKSGTDEADVYIPEPLLQWSIVDLMDSAWREKAYKTIKRYCTEYQRASHALLFGESYSIMWNTNDASSIRSAYAMGMGIQKELQVLAEQSEPALKALLMHTWRLPEETRRFLLLALLALVQGLRRAGASIDTLDTIEKVCLVECIDNSEDDGTTKTLPNKYTLDLNLSFKKAE